MDNIRNCPTDPPCREGIYYFTKNGNQVNPIRCSIFSDDELIRINFSILIMERLFKNLRRSEAVNAAYKEFRDEAKKPSGENPYEIEEVDRRFRAFLFEWKLYTEHWKAYILDLNESVWPYEFIAGYQTLNKKLMHEAFTCSDFVIAHILRNYVSHANAAIDDSHVDGRGTKFSIYRATLEKFLQGTICRATGKKRKELQSQLCILQTQEELMDLATIADKAIAWQIAYEKALLDYQVVEPQLIQACNILMQAKQKIDESCIKSDVWEFWTLQPIYLDHQGLHSFTMQANINGQVVTYVYYRNRVNWIGYEAVVSYLMGIIPKVQAD